MLVPISPCLALAASERQRGTTFRGSLCSWAVTLSNPSYAGAASQNVEFGDEPLERVGIAVPHCARTWMTALRRIWLAEMAHESQDSLPHIVIHTALEHLVEFLQDAIECDSNVLENTRIVTAPYARPGRFSKSLEDSCRHMNLAKQEQDQAAEHVEVCGLPPLSPVGRNLPVVELERRVGSVARERILVVRGHKRSLRGAS